MLKVLAELGVTLAVDIPQQAGAELAALQARGGLRGQGGQGGEDGPGGGPQDG